MKVSQEKSPNSQITLTIEIPADASKQAYEKVVKDLARTVRIPGFRKGKVPRPILLQRLGPERVRAEALENLVQSTVMKAVSDEKIDVLGNYQIHPDISELLTQYKPGEVFTFKASMDVPPEVTLGDYTALSVKAEKSEYDPTQVDQFLASQQAKVATLVPVEGRAAQRGDVVVVNYQGRLVVDGEVSEAVISGAEATDFQLELESDKFLEDLISGIEGMNPGETKDIPVAFPDDYAREDLAGETAQFSVTLQEIKEKELPELDDDFAEEISRFETLAELREDLETQYKKQAEDTTNSRIEDAIAQELLTIAEIDPPETLIKQEVDMIIRQTVSQMEQYGLDMQSVLKADMMPTLRENARPEAIERLKTTLVLEEVARRESLEPDPEKLDQQVKEIFEQLSDQPLDEDRVREFVSKELLQAQALEWLRDKVTVELVPEGTLNPPSEDTEASAEAEAEAILAEAVSAEEE
ncbi:MAG: trigger factor [Wenzhouxiangella sp.]|jgi:trigger factor|nr:trigger factor [Wenzhouxiangella sp.]